MPVHAVLAVLDEVPVARALVEQVIPLPADIRRWVFVACAEDQSDRVRAALVGFAVVAPHQDTEVPGDADTLEDVKAFAWALGAAIFEAPAKGPFVTDGAYLNLQAFALATPDRARVRACLEQAGLTCADAPSLVADRTPLSDEAALVRAMVPFDESFTPEVAAAVRAWLTGPDAAIPDVVLHAASKAYGDRRASFAYEALTGAVEQWNPRISGKLLDLWLAWRGPLVTDIHLGLGEEDLLPELGVDRARMVAAALADRGLAPALAVLAGTSCQGGSTSLLAASYLPHPEFFTAAVAVDLSKARELAWYATLCAVLDDSPRYKQHVRAFLAGHNAALGVAALTRLVTDYADDIDDAHLATAAVDADALALCRLAVTLEGAAPERHAGATRRANERWVSAADPAKFATTLHELLEQEADAVDVEVAWGRLIDLIDANPRDPFGTTPEGSPHAWDDFVVGHLRKPQGAVKARLVALCERHGDKFTKYTLKALEKQAGIKRKAPPFPYADGDLEGLPAACAKAWKTARTKSWKAERTLPASAGEAALVAAEQALGVALPGELRSFYALHDGAGEDECFNGSRLYGVAEAVEQRQTLLTIAGAPFDATWLPVTDDGGGNHQCVVLSGPKAGTVVDFDHESGGGRTVSKSFATFVQNARWE